MARDCVAPPFCIVGLHVRPTLGCTCGSGVRFVYATSGWQISLTRVDLIVLRDRQSDDYPRLPSGAFGVAGGWAQVVMDPGRDRLRSFEMDGPRLAVALGLPFGGVPPTP